jgi:hypothetical protein
MYRARLQPALYMSGLLHCIMYMMRATKLRYLVACSIVINFVPSPLHRLDPGTAGCRRLWCTRHDWCVIFFQLFDQNRLCKLDGSNTVITTVDVNFTYSLNTGSALASNELVISASRASRSAFAPNAMISSTQTAKQVNDPPWSII